VSFRRFSASADLLFDDSQYVFLLCILVSFLGQQDLKTDKNILEQTCIYELLFLHQQW